jgi:hypothetical protein
MKSIIMLHAVLLAMAFAGLLPAQNYSECQAPDAHMNPKCNPGLSGPSSMPTPPAELNITGNYDVKGSSPDGGRYEGTVTISGDQQNGFQLNWKIGADEYQGTGVLAGDTLTVEWGAPEPVVYKVSDGGAKLKGKWGKKGKGREILTRSPG